MSVLTKQPVQYNDPMLDEIHNVKRAVSARAGHDVARLCRELREEQERGGAKIVRHVSADERSSKPAQT